MYVCRYGYETDSFIVRGLQYRSYKSYITQMKSLGFNALRLPFSNQMIRQSASGFTVDPYWTGYNINPDLYGLTPLQTLDVIITYAGSVGMRIILDRHSAKSNNFWFECLWYIPGDAYYTEARFIQDWVFLANRYKGSCVLGADLWNEPKYVPGQVCATWGTNAASDWNLAATRVGNAILSANSNWLIVVEGLGDIAQWGENLGPVANYPIILSMPNKVVYSAHEYSNDEYPQTWFNDPTFPNNLPAHFRSFWGFVYENNIGPVFIGETGLDFSQATDAQWLSTMISYMNAPGGGSDTSGNAKGISWAYWVLNPDTGAATYGLLLSDWTTVDTRKLNALQKAFIGATLIP